VSSLSVLTAEAWHVFGIGIGQSEIISFGLIVGTTIIVGYRLLTRGKKYGHE
jgi:hypothetical protein